MEELNKGQRNVKELEYNYSRVKIRMESEITAAKRQYDELIAANKNEADIHRLELDRLRLEQDRLKRERGEAIKRIQAAFADRLEVAYTDMAAEWAARSAANAEAFVCTWRTARRSAELLSAFGKEKGFGDHWGMRLNDNEVVELTVKNEPRTEGESAIDMTDAGAEA